MHTQTVSPPSLPPPPPPFLSLHTQNQVLRSCLYEGAGEEGMYHSMQPSSAGAGWL